MSDTPQLPHRRRAHTSNRDLARYAALFADRTKVMRSSAMRDLMAITARPEVISLAGGLPDTSTFPPQSFAAQMTRIAQESAAEALQYGPTEGFEETKDCILQVMGAEGMLPDHDDVIVTTGGQQAIDLVCKTLVDPGDVVICEAPTYPGAVPVFCSYEAETIQVECDENGMKVEELEPLLARLDAEGRKPKLIYTVPTFQNPAGVTMSLERRQRLVELARRRELLVVEDNPYGLLRFSGEQLPPLYQLDGGDFVIYIGTFSKILSPGIRLGWAVAPPPVMEKIVLGKQATDLCTSTLTQYFVREYFAEGRWGRYIEELVALYRRRRDTMLLALEEHFPAAATWTRPEGGLFIWATLPEYIDTADLLAKALRADVAFVPGAAAYVDGRGGSSMRLNFSGVGEDEIREGVRRIGKVIAEQVDLYEALTGEHTIPVPRPESAPDRGERAAVPADGGRPGVRVAVLKGGRSLERGVSLRSGARVEDALERLGHEVTPIDVGADLVKRLADRPDVAFVAMHGVGGEDGTTQELLEILGIPFTGPGAASCARCMDKSLAKHAMREAGIPTPDWFAFSQAAFRELGAADALGRIEQALGFPLVVKPSRGGSSLGVKFAGSAAEVPQALVAAFSYDDRILLERFVDGRELAVSVVGDEALPIVEAIPAEGDRYDFEARYAIGRTRFVSPGRARPGRERGGDRRRARHLPGARLHRLRPRRRDARRAAAPGCSRPTRSRASPTPASSPRPRRRRACRSSSWSSGSSSWRWRRRRAA